MSELMFSPGWKPAAVSPPAIRANSGAEVVGKHRSGRRRGPNPAAAEVIVGTIVDLIVAGAGGKYFEARLIIEELEGLGPDRSRTVRNFLAAVSEAADACGYARDLLRARGLALVHDYLNNRFESLHEVYRALLRAALTEARCADLQQSAALHAHGAGGTA
jgi:hypothetical protein